MIKGENQGMLRVYADRKSGRLLGATLVMAEAEHLGHWLALAIDRGLTVPDCLAQTFYHPVMEEALREVLQACLSECKLSSNYPPGLRPCD